MRTAARPVEFVADATGVGETTGIHDPQPPVSLPDQLLVLQERERHRDLRPGEPHNERDRLLGELDIVPAQCVTCEEQPTAEPLTQRMRVNADGRLHHLKDDVVDVRQDGLLEFLTSAKLAEDRIRANAVGLTGKLDAEIDG